MNKENGRKYAYYFESTWDPEQKKTVVKQKAAGWYFDPDTGERVSSRKKGEVEQKRQEQAADSLTALPRSVQAAGDTLLPSHVAQEVGLPEALQAAFPQD